MRATLLVLAVATLAVGCKTEPSGDGGGGAKPQNSGATKPPDMPPPAVLDRKVPIETLCARYVDLAEAGGPKFVPVVRKAKLDKCAARAKDLDIETYNCVVTCTEAAKDYATARNCRGNCKPVYGSKGGVGGAPGGGGGPGKAGAGPEGAAGSAAPSARADGAESDDVP